MATSPTTTGLSAWPTAQALGGFVVPNSFLQRADSPSALLFSLDGDGRPVNVTGLAPPGPREPVEPPLNSTAKAREWSKSLEDRRSKRALKRVEAVAADVKAEAQRTEISTVRPATMVKAAGRAAHPNKPPRVSNGNVREEMKLYERGDLPVSTPRANPPAVLPLPALLASTAAERPLAASWSKKQLPIDVLLKGQQAAAARASAAAAAVDSLGSRARGISTLHHDGCNLPHSAVADAFLSSDDDAVISVMPLRGRKSHFLYGQEAGMSTGASRAALNVLQPTRSSSASSSHTDNDHDLLKRSLSHTQLGKFETAAASSALGTSRTKGTLAHNQAVGADASRTRKLTLSRSSKLSMNFVTPGKMYIILSVMWCLCIHAFMCQTVLLVLSTETHIDMMSIVQYCYFVVIVSMIV